MSKTLLWVEDDPNDILLGQRAMAKVGLEAPQLVRDGQEAIDYLAGEGKFQDRSQHPCPSVILLDLKLPKLSGFEVLRWLREQPVLRRIPVVVLTSSKESGDINRAYDLGANAYLVKAVDFKELVAVLELIRAFCIKANRAPVFSPSEHAPCAKANP